MARAAAISTMASIATLLLLGGAVADGAVGDGVLPPLEAAEVPPLPPGVEAPLLAGDWPSVDAALATKTVLDASPVARLVLAHALVMENRNTDALLLFLAAADEDTLRAWDEWTLGLTVRAGDSSIAHFLRGDALARRRRWSEATAEFDATLARDPGLTIARVARGVVRAATGESDAALLDLSEATAEAPDLAEAHLSLGTFWLARRAPEGGLAAFEKALSLSPNSAVALNGRACARYGLGHWELAAADFGEAGNALPLAFVWRNLRSVTLAADMLRSGEAESSVVFHLSDFLDWAALAERVDGPCELLRTILDGRPFPSRPTDDAVALFNAALDDPTLLERHRRCFDLGDLPADVVELVDQTESDRDVAKHEPTENEKGRLRRLNRRLIEIAYTPLIAEYQDRNPGTQLTAHSGLVNPFSINQQVAWKQGLPTEHLQIAQGRMQAQQPFADVAVSLAVASRNPVAIGAAASWKAALSIGLKSTDIVLSQRPIQPPQAFGPNPGGVLIDLRRAHVDRSEWTVEAPFDLAYADRLDIEAGRDGEHR